MEEVYTINTGGYSMSAHEHLERYAEGWSKGDVDVILQTVTDTYVFDDPHAGRIAKSDFREYFAELKKTVASLRGDAETQFMEFSEQIGTEEAGVVTAWCWWGVPGTSLEGSRIIKVWPQGVVSERIAYYTRLPG